MKNVSRTRGIIAARADMSDPKKVLADLNNAWNEFKAANDDNAIKGKVDGLLTEKMAQTNAAMTELQGQLDALNQKMVAASASRNADNPDRVEHRNVFNQWFRRGGSAESALADLEVKAGLTSQSKPDGGYLVPTEMETQIDRVLGTQSAMRRLATVRQIGTSEYKKLVNVGGAGSGWVGEEESRTETNTPSLRELAFSIMEIYAEPYATQTMLDDSIVDIEAWLADEVQTEFAEEEGAAHISGSGVKRPRGILSYTNVANASYAWGSVGFVVTGAAAAFHATTPGDAFIDTYYALKSGYREGASWITSDAVMPSIRKMKDGQGNYLWAPPTAVEGPATILGKPVETDDNMPALAANAFPVAFGNWKRAYLVLDRVGIRVLRNPYKSNGKVAFYTTKRTGGGVQNFEALKLMKCSA